MDTMDLGFPELNENTAGVLANLTVNTTDYGSCYDEKSVWGKFCKETYGIFDSHRSLDLKTHCIINKDFMNMVENIRKSLNSRSYYSHNKNGDRHDSSNVNNLNDGFNNAHCNNNNDRNNISFGDNNHDRNNNNVDRYHINDGSNYGAGIAYRNNNGNRNIRSFLNSPELTSPNNANEKVGSVGNRFIKLCNTPGCNGSGNTNLNSDMHYSSKQCPKKRELDSNYFQCQYCAYDRKVKYVNGRQGLIAHIRQFHQRNELFNL